MSGTNDSLYELETGEHQIPPEDYRDNLLNIIDISRKYAKDVVLVGNTPIDESEVDPVPWKPTHAYRNEELEKYREKMGEVVEEKGLKFVDVRSEIDEEDFVENKLKDGIHPNTEGHKQIYRIVKQVLKQEDVIPDAA